MSNLLKLKLYFIALLFIVSLCFSKELFPVPIGAIHQFSQIDIIIASICFGVILSATIYNLSLYLFTKHKIHLYYALAQISALFFLVNLDSLFIAPFDTIFGLKSFMLFNISQIFMLIFSILFLESFFRTYQIKELKRLTRIILYIALFDLSLTLILSHSIITTLIPIFIPIWLVLSEAFRLTHYRDFPFYFIMMGWTVVLVTVTFEYIGLLALTGITFPFLHISIALESIILSLAIAYKFKLLEEEKKTQQTLLLQQSRLAHMGEMISIIAHQWKQPLNFISFSLMNIKRQLKGNDKSLSAIKKINSQVQYMSLTMEDFRNFYNPTKEKNDFLLSIACEKSIMIATNSLDLIDISLTLKVVKDFTLFGNLNEFEQVILNIINNAKDAFESREIEEAKIEIVVDRPIVIITDNAGGIDKRNLDKIFTMYFSTKNSGEGIGLYIVKVIVEKELDGEIEVKTDSKGSDFILSFSKTF
jgi:signal transduction histidine kinase